MNSNHSLASSILTVSDSMNSSELGAAIHKHFEEHPEGEVRVEKADGKSITIKTERGQFKGGDIVAIDSEPPRRPHTNIGTFGRSSFLPMAVAMLASHAQLGGESFGYSPRFGAPSKKAERENPERVKTPEDLARIEAARAKQARKAAKRAAAVGK